MSSSGFFHAQVASIMDVLTKRAVHEIIKLVDNGSAAFGEEISRRQRENETLKRKLLRLEGELKAARGYGEGILDNSLNISLEVQVCDDLRENQRPKVLQGSDSATASGHTQRISTDAATNDQDGNALHALEIKDEPVDWLHDWTEPVLDGEDRLEENPKCSQSQPGQKISEESTSGAAAANGVERQCMWREAPSSGSARVRMGEHGRTLERRAGRADEMVTLRHPRRSQRLEGKERGRASQLEPERNGGHLDEGHSGGLLNDVLGEVAFRLSSAREGSGNDASSDESTEVNNQWAIEGQEELIPSVSGKTFPDSLELKTDEGQHGEEKGFNCSECGQDFTDSENLEKHLLTHSRERPFSCSQCDKSFPHLSSVQAHERTHSRQKPFVCPVCNKRFLSKSYLKIHQRIHTREKPFICDWCGKGFTQISNLKTHQIMHAEVGCFSCMACDLRFDSVSLLKHHRRVHHDERGLICKRCGKSFDSADSLKQHRLANHKEKLFTCSLCKKCFTAKSSLKTHQSVHTGEKPYTCGDCGKSFAHQHNLNTHQRVHTGEKPYSCTLCGRAFTQNHTLQSHLRIHAVSGLKEQARDQCIGICS